MENKIQQNATGVQNQTAVNSFAQNQPQIAPPTPYVYKPKVYKPLTKNDGIFSALLLVCCFMFINFALFGGFHLGFTLAYIVTFAVSTAYLIKRDLRFPTFSVICGLLSVAGSVTFALYNDYLINFVMFLLVMGLFVVYTMGISNTFLHKQGSFKLMIDLAKSAFASPIMHLPNVFGGIKASSKKNKKPMGSIVGVLVALPVAVVLVALLVESDAAFEGLVSSIAGNIGIYLVELVLAVLILPFVFSYLHEKKEYEQQDKKTKSKLSQKKLSSSACISFMSVISVVYIVYLFSQLAYFFSAFKGLLPAGYEYSASVFARRGFFEMSGICAINIILVSIVTMLCSKNEKGTVPMPIKLLSCFISLFSVLLLITAMQKMRLNVQIFGLSKNRLLVSVFMLMMFVVIVFFIVHIFAPKISYMQPIIIICSVIFIAMSYADIDAQIAKYNINAYESGVIDSLDVEMLGDLSDSAVPYIAELVSSNDAEISNSASKIIAYKMINNYASSRTDDEIEVPENSDFRDFNMSKSRAIKSARKLCSNELVIKEYKEYTGSYDYDDDTQEAYDYNC